MATIDKKDQTIHFGEAFLKSEKKLLEDLRNSKDFNKLMNDFSNYPIETIIAGIQTLLEELKKSVVEHNAGNIGEDQIKLIKKELLLLFSVLKDMEIIKEQGTKPEV